MTKEETRQRIVRAASQLFRERGVKATTVPDVMDACGLTVGGFYKHFESKEDLFRTALEEALIDTRRRFDAMDPALRGEPWRRAVANFYLSEQHRDHPGGGCVLAALCGDLQRTDADTRRWFEGGLNRLIGMFAERMEGETESERRAQAWQFLAGLVGGLLMARSVAGGDTSREILESCREIESKTS